MATYSDSAVLSLIGNTPLIKVTRLNTGICELFLKLESQNPGGSIKDRVGLAMIEAAEHDGRLRPGGVVIEATAGNTGLGLALVARAKGYRIGAADELLPTLRDALAADTVSIIACPVDYTANSALIAALGELDETLS